jgi:hypothetical protein
MYLYETISLRYKIQDATLSSSLPSELNANMNLENLKNQLALEKSICDKQDCSEPNSTEFLCPTLAFDDVIRDFRNLYDVAFIVSKLGKNHQMAFEIYKHLKYSILIRCGITTLDRKGYENLLNSSIYVKIIEALDYWDVLRVMRDMAYEQIQIAKSAPNDWYRSTKSAIQIYEEVVSLEGRDNGTKTLNTCAWYCYTFSRTNGLSSEEKSHYLEKSRIYYKKALEIARSIYTESHPSVVKLKESLDNITK